MVRRSPTRVTRWKPLTGTVYGYPTAELTLLLADYYQATENHQKLAGPRSPLTDSWFRADGVRTSRIMKMQPTP